MLTILFQLSIKITLTKNLQAQSEAYHMYLSINAGRPRGLWLCQAPSLVDILNLGRNDFCYIEKKSMEIFINVHLFLNL